MLKNQTLKILKKELHIAARMLKNLILIALLTSVAILIMIFATHKIKMQSEIDTLDENQLYSPVEISNNKSMNVTLYGDKNAERTIVTISDVNVNDFSVFVKHIAYKMRNDVQFALVDRFGHGFSDDVLSERNIEVIVDNYRTALKKAGVDGPYVLLAHKFGGVYATYWSIAYPDEIESIIYIDGTEIIDDVQIKKEEKRYGDYIKIIMCKMGLHRILLDNNTSHLSKMLSKPESDCVKSLNLYSTNTFAGLSELMLQNDNFSKTMDIFKSTDVPKMYISVSNSFSTEKEVIKYYKYKNEQHEEAGLAPFYEFGTDEQTAKDAKQFIDECVKKYENETKPFVKALGNCQLTNIPGDSKLYEQQTEGLYNAIFDFLKYLDGEVDSVESYYEDRTLVDWDQYQETHGVTDLIRTTKVN